MIRLSTQLSKPPMRVKRYLNCLTSSMVMDDFRNNHYDGHLKNKTLNIEHIIAYNLSYVWWDDDIEAEDTTEHGIYSNKQLDVFIFTIQDRLS